MRADEYVVAELEKTKNLLNEISAQNIFLRQDNKELEKKYDFIKSLFYVEETSAKCGYHICINDLDGYFKSIIITTYHKNPEEIEPEFMELLNALGLTLPEPTNEDLENDPELVEQAMEKAKELQAKKESEEK